jgi:hypothetical protein
MLLSLHRWFLFRSCSFVIKIRQERCRFGSRPRCCAFGELASRGFGAPHMLATSIDLNYLTPGACVAVDPYFGGRGLPELGQAVLPSWSPA